MENISALRNAAVLLEPCLRIGKNGVTGGIIAEVSVLLKKRQMIKIKILKGALEQQSKEEIIARLVKESGAVLVNSVGLTFTLYKSP